MKLISKIFAATVLLVIAASCGNNSREQKGTLNNNDTLYNASRGYNRTNRQVGKSRSSSNSSLVGTWVLTNAPKGASATFVFQRNGSFRLNMRRDQDNETVHGQWSLNGKNMYLSAQGESEVLVMEILSFDGSSLVVHFKGESEDEISYFVRSN